MTAVEPESRARLEELFGAGEAAPAAHVASVLERYRRGCACCRDVAGQTVACGGARRRHGPDARAERAPRHRSGRPLRRRDPATAGCRSALRPRARPHPSTADRRLRPREPAGAVREPAGRDRACARRRLEAGRHRESRASGGVQVRAAPEQHGHHSSRWPGSFRTRKSSSRRVNTPSYGDGVGMVKPARRALAGVMSSRPPGLVLIRRSARGTLRRLSRSPSAAKASRRHRIIVFGNGCSRRPAGRHYAAHCPLATRCANVSSLLAVGHRERRPAHLPRRSSRPAGPVRRVAPTRAPVKTSRTLLPRRAQTRDGSIASMEERPPLSRARGRHRDPRAVEGSRRADPLRRPARARSSRLTGATLPPARAIAQLGERLVAPRRSPVRAWLAP